VKDVDMPGRLLTLLDEQSPSRILLDTAFAGIEITSGYMPSTESFTVYCIVGTPVVRVGHIVFAPTWANGSECEGYACMNAAVIASEAVYRAGAVVVSLDKVADRHCV